MQKVFSARLDEAVLDEMERVTRKLKMTKRRFLEEAISRRAKDLAGGSASDVWSETLGAWNRKETPAATLRNGRRSFESSFGRARPGRRARVRR